MGLHDVHLSDMDTVAEAAAPFYNNHLRGGEGHMEVGKLIVTRQGQGDHDPVGEAVRLHAVGGRLGRRSVDDHQKYPRGSSRIETNGDGAVNVYSRVQMMLFKARLAARAEYEAELKKHGLSAEELRAYLGTKRWRGSSLFYPRHGTVASTAANLVQHVVSDLKKTRVGKLVDFTKAVLARGAAPQTSTSAEPELRSATAN